MKQRKASRMQPFEAELEAGGVEYTPVTFSCYGRPHPDASRLLQTLGRRLGRRKGTEAHVEERRLAARIGVEIWRRAAQMLRHCLPDSADDAAQAEAAMGPLSAEVLQRVGHPRTLEPEPI